MTKIVFTTTICPYDLMSDKEGTSKNGAGNYQSVICTVCVWTGTQRRILFVSLTKADTKTPERCTHSLRLFVCSHKPVCSGVKESSGFAEIPY